MKRGDRPDLINEEKFNEKTIYCFIVLHSLGILFPIINYFEFFFKLFAVPSFLCLAEFKMISVEFYSPS